MTHGGPTIVNLTEYTIVVFQERGVFFNTQILKPREALTISRFQAGSLLLPYKVHAVIGDERNLPNRKQSMKNLAAAAIMPTAFAVGALAAAMSAGVLTGPSVALAPLVSGMVVQGVVIDAAAIAAGSVVAARALVVSEMLVKKYPEKFMCKTNLLLPGKRFIVVTGGLEAPLEINTNIKERDFKKLRITTFKEPAETMPDKLKSPPGIEGTERNETITNEVGALITS